MIHTAGSGNVEVISSLEIYWRIANQSGYLNEKHKLTQVFLFKKKKKKKGGGEREGEFALGLSHWLGMQIVYYAQQKLLKCCKLVTLGAFGEFCNPHFQP